MTTTERNDAATVLDPTERATLAAVADRLIPAAHGRPAYASTRTNGLSTTTFAPECIHGTNVTTTVSAST